jgi:hypothetical protein
MQVQTAAQTIRQQLIILDARSDADIESPLSRSCNARPARCWSRLARS